MRKFSFSLIVFCMVLLTISQVYAQCYTEGGQTRSGETVRDFSDCDPEELTAEDIINVDTGSYPLIYPVTISGSVDMALGLDEGFTMRGPLDPAIFEPAEPAGLCERALRRTAR